MKERASCEPETAEYLRETDNTPAKKKTRCPEVSGFLNLAPLTGLELHLYLLLLLALFKLNIFLPTYLPSLLLSYQ